MSVNVPVPTFVRLPRPVSFPANALDTLLPPTDRVKAEPEFVSVNVPELFRPPNVAAESVPRESVPAPDVSNVLPKRAFALPSVSVPPETSVSPENVLVPVVLVEADVTSVGASVRFPPPPFVNARLPVMMPKNVPVVA